MSDVMPTGEDPNPNMPDAAKALSKKSDWCHACERDWSWIDPRDIRRLIADLQRLREENEQLAKELSGANEGARRLRGDLDASTSEVSRLTKEREAPLGHCTHGHPGVALVRWSPSPDEHVIACPQCLIGERDEWKAKATERDRGRGACPQCARDMSIPLPDNCPSCGHLLVMTPRVEPNEKPVAWLVTGTGGLEWATTLPHEGSKNSQPLYLRPAPPAPTDPVEFDPNVYVPPPPNEAAKPDLTAELADARRERDENIAERLANTEYYHAEIAKLKAEVDLREREWQNAIVDHEEKRDEATRMREALERHAESAEAEIAKLKAERDTCKAAHDDAQRHASDYASDIEKLRAQLDSTRRIKTRVYWQFAGYTNQYGSVRDARLAQGMQVRAGHLDGKTLLKVTRYRVVKPKPAKETK